MTKKIGSPRGGGWSPGQLFREATRNTVSGRWFSAALVCVIAAMTFGALLVDAQTVAGIHKTEAQFLNDGGNIVVVAGVESSATVDAAACAAMQDSGDVIASGAVKSRLGGAAITGRPEAIQAIHYVTPGFEKIAGSEVSLGANHVISSKIIADRWLVSPGSYVGFERAEGLDPVARIADVADMERLGDAFTTTLLMLMPAAGTAEECYIMAQPWAIENVAARAPALLGDSTDNALRADSLQTLGQYTTSFDEQFTDRATQFAPLVAGLAVGVLAGLLMWIRRGRYALYSTLGMTYGQVVQLRLYEWLALIGLGVIPGTAAAVGYVAWTGLGTSISPTYWALSLAAHGALVGFAALLVVAVCAPFKPATLAALKER